MTVSTEVDHNDYIGNSVTTVFPYQFRIFKAADLTVVTVDLDETQRELILGTDYTVTGAGSYQGGNVVLASALANGWKISIARELPVTQETDLRNQGKFFAEVHENAFDKLTMLIQQTFSRFSLALRKPSFIANYYDALNNRIRNLRDPSQSQDAATKNYVDSLANTNLSKTLRTPEAISQLPDAASRANKIVAFDNYGQPFATLPPSGSASDVLIELAKPTGAGLVGTENGNNVQEELDFQKGDYNRKIGKKHRKRVVASWNWVFPDYAALQATYSYTILIPQGMAIDENYYYVSYSTNDGSGVNKWIWVAIYDRVTAAYVECFSIPNTDAASYCESLYVRMNGSQRVIYTTADFKAVGYDITTFPPNKGAVTTKVFEYTNCSAFAPSPEGLTMFRTDSFDRMLVTIGWDSVVRGVALLPESAHTLAAKPNPYRQTRGKVQARAMYNGELVIVGCARYDESDANNSLIPLNAPFYIRVNSSGVVSEHHFYNPDFFLKSIDSTDGKNVLENEGIAVSPDGILHTLWYTDGAGPTSIKIIEELSVEDNSTDFTVGLTNTMASSIKDAKFVYYNTSWINPYTNQRFNSVDDIFSMILQLDIKYPLSFYTNVIFNLEASGARKVPAGTLMTFQMMSDSTIYISFVGRGYSNSAVSSNIGNYSIGNVQVGGTVGDSFLTTDCVVLGAGGGGAIHTKRDTTSGATHLSFYNPNGSVGSISTNGSATSFNTTSDITLKIDKGEIIDAIDLIVNIFESGAVRYASYKTEPDKVFPMYMAQNLAEHFPSAVTEGRGSPGDIDYMPWSVDYSKITPVLLAAIYKIIKNNH